MNPRYRFRRTRHIFLSRRLWSRRILFIVGAVMVGLVSVGFAASASWANGLFHTAIARYRYSTFLILPAGFAAVLWLMRRYAPTASGSGIPQAIAALTVPDDRRLSLLSLRVAVAKVALTCLGLLSGASIGREGPSVQVGASIMYALSRTPAFPYPGMQRGLVLAGAAAGIAAAFNAPLAGVVFAIEEMARSFEQRTVGIVVTAVIVAGVVSLALLGNYAYFGRTTADMDMLTGWKAVVACGLAGGALGGLFSRVLIGFGTGADWMLNRLRRESPIAFAAGCGLVMAILGLLSGNSIFGTGYEETRAILQGEPGTQAFGALKLLATLTSYVSGIPGGIFAPSLAVGAGLGQNLSLMFSNLPASAVVLLGMSGYFAGVVQAPLTAFVIVLEMTQNAEMALPLMACTLLANSVARMVCPRPLYKALAKQFKGNP